MEEEMEGILVQAQEKFITPLLSFRKEQIGSVKATKKAFEKATNKLCVAQVKWIVNYLHNSIDFALDIIKPRQKQGLLYEMLGSFLTSQDKYVSMSGKREESLAEASETLRLEQRNLNSSSLE